MPVALGLALGVAADEVIGDPRRGHPVASYGRAVSAIERRWYGDDRAHGVVFAALALAPLVLAARRIDLAVHSRPVMRTALVGLATWSVVGGHSLRRIGAQMADLLAAGDTAAARQLLPSLCGRDPDSLDERALARASIESLAENTSDAVVAPLLWGTVGGLAGLVGYRAVNTLDAMVGHRSPRYARFGTAAARLDDAANLVPARVAGLLTLAAARLVGGSPAMGWAAWRAGAAAHPSPNAGVCEAAAAGVLGVRLGGTTVYAGRVEQRPPLGPRRIPEVADIRRMVTLSRVVEFAALAVAALLAGCGRR